MKMKLSLALLVVGISSASAFAPPATFTTAKVSTTQVNAEPDEEDGLDLDLGEMFEMFDAADKGQDFDDAIKKVKGDE